METILLQPLISVKEPSSVVSLTQPRDRWLDVPNAQDLVFVVDYWEVTPGGASNLTLFFETAPTEDEAFFQTLTQQSFAAGGTTSAFYIKATMPTATVPQARFLRWRLAPQGGTLSSTWTMTMRIVVCAQAVSGG